MTAPNAEFAAQVAEAAELERAARIDSLGREPVLWLAAVPLWTASAAAAAGFPAADVLVFVRQARDVGWCEARGPLRDGGAGEVRFWMPAEHRRAVLDLLIRRDGEGRLIDSKYVADRVAQLSGEPGIVVPGALRDWAELRRDFDPDRTLVDFTRGAIERGNLSGAQDLVSAGEALAALLGGTMELAVDRARRLLSLGTRRRQDARALARYQDRPELSRAVDRLLRDDTSQWALHLRGVGGVGKTMLIRSLASGQYPDPIARVDFDHMNPDYPVRRPVQLLLELADELALHTAAVGRADRALSRFRATAASVHESLSGVREERPDPMHNPRVLAAIDDFSAAIRELPRVLLILDTCEELAKADAGDPAAPAVQITLAILKHIHERTPSVRVLFAGRRPLPPRDYLAVQDVAGFTLEEARRYLATFSARPLKRGLADAMIRQSAAVDAAVPAAGELPSRVSPFDLALYLAWADEDPRLDARRVAEGSDAYIEGRIIERLRDPGVLAALPLLASAGRCRVATIASFTGADPAVLGPRLAEQEWIDFDGDPPLHVAARPALASRLRHYFGAPDRAAVFAADTARLAQALRGQVASAELGEVDADELLAALRLSEPAEAARLWDDLAERAASAGRWSWLLNVTRRVLGESAEERWPTASALRASALASYIAASRRASATFSVRTAWEEVRARAADHPDPAATRVLLARAALGLLPYTPDDESVWGQLLVDSLELAAAAADSAHRLLETGATAAAERMLTDGYLSAALDVSRDWRRPPRLRRVSDRVLTWVLVALARLRADHGDLRGALEALNQAEAAAVRAGEADDTSPAEPGLADWIPPSDLLARVLLEFRLLAPPVGDFLVECESFAANHLDSIDGERLASLCLRTRLSLGVVARSEIERWEAIDGYEPGRVATCTAHDLVPPLFASLADAWLSAGYPQRALDLIERRRAAALDTREDEATIRYADAATIRIVRRLRLDDQRALLRRLSADTDLDPSRTDLPDSSRRALAVVYGEPAPYDLVDDLETRPPGWHAYWQSQSTNSHVPRPRWPPDGTETELAADIELDIEEMRQREHPAYEQSRDALADWLAQPRPAPRVRSADPYRDARAGLRRAALAGDGIHECPPEVPPRLFAEMAFDEAELLALRLPDAAARMFGYAYVAYGTCEDLMGQLLAAASRVAITGNPPDLGITLAALDDLSTSLPDVRAALSGPVAEAGPWRYWAEYLQRLSADEDKRLTVVSRVSTATRAASWLGNAAVTCLDTAGLVVGVVVACLAYPAASTIGMVSLLGALLAGIAVTGNWRLRGALQVAEGRGVGAFRLAALGFTALVGGAPADRQRVYLWAHVRPLGSARRRQWPRLGLLALVGGLAAPFRRKARSGYAGMVRESLNWETDPPAADGTWWAAGTAPGVLFVSWADAARPWERIITESLGPDAAGHIEWYRRGAGTFWGRRHPDSEAQGVALVAPPEWKRPFAHFYAVAAGGEPNTPAPDALVRIRHAIGRAVSTSAGPRLDVSGEQATTSRTGELLGTDELASGSPSLIVLQAEPTPDHLAAWDRDDLLEKLALAVDLTETGVGCDVLIVPALSDRLTGTVTAAIADHAAQRRDSRELQAELRRLLRPEVEPAVLDDIVLFWNRVRYK